MKMQVSCWEKVNRRRGLLTITQIQRDEAIQVLVKTEQDLNQVESYWTEFWRDANLGADRFKDLKRTSQDRFWLGTFLIAAQKALRPVQWYARQIKPEKELREQLKLMDVVTVLQDGRIPLSTIHPKGGENRINPRGEETKTRRPPRGVHLLDGDGPLPSLPLTYAQTMSELEDVKQELNKFKLDLAYVLREKVVAEKEVMELGVKMEIYLYWFGWQ
ncbi:unnamed protein product [Microthlaspi erraticum]|uniref:Uncharacterized protein n=1 Tax=Microthlaspi erraticum TaxID=1685480 RepID=A0A6D2JBB4_9BRAS|nr:unnamed protein product [Microthlaspi erraticum]